jgi:hypothetical protein
MASSRATKFARRDRRMALLVVLVAPAVEVLKARAPAALEGMAHRRAALAATVRRHGAKGTKVRLPAAEARIARPGVSAACPRNNRVRGRFAACAADARERRSPAALFRYFVVR